MWFMTEEAYREFEDERWSAFNMDHIYERYHEERKALEMEAMWDEYRDAVEAREYELDIKAREGGP